MTMDDYMLPVHELRHNKEETFLDFFDTLSDRNALHLQRLRLAVVLHLHAQAMSDTKHELLTYFRSRAGVDFLHQALDEAAKYHEGSIGYISPEYEGDVLQAHFEQLLRIRAKLEALTK